MNTPAPPKAKYALITGASSGIGEQMARQLAARGHPLIVVARRAERLERLRAELVEAHGVDVVVLAADLSAAGAAAALFDEVTARALPVDILVNNAGFGLQGRFLDMAPPDIEEMFRLNVTTLTQLTWFFAREMRRTGGGHVLQVASAAAFLPSAYLSAYAATKAYVLGFSEALRFELRHTGVSVTTLYPGITTTEFNAVAKARTPAVMRWSVLSAERVARVGLDAMFNRRRAVVPGVINKINAVMSHMLPRGMIIHLAGLLLERANEHQRSSG